MLSFLFAILYRSILFHTVSHCIFSIVFMKPQNKFINFRSKQDKTFTKFRRPLSLTVHWLFHSPCPLLLSFVINCFFYFPIFTQTQLAKNSTKSVCLHCYWVLFILIKFRPLCLPQSWNDDINKYEGRAAITTGWGSVSNVNIVQSATLKKWDVTIFDLR